MNVAKYVRLRCHAFTPNSVAKFLADFVVFLHYEFWKVWGRLRNIGHGRQSPGASAGGSSGDLFGDSDDEQVKAQPEDYIRLSLNCSEFLGPSSACPLSTIHCVCAGHHLRLSGRIPDPAILRAEMVVSGVPLLHIHQHPHCR